jgi:hypothetical protein
MFRNLLVLFCFISFGTVAQTNRYFVFFKDKTGTPFTPLPSLKIFLSAKSIARRQQSANNYYRNRPAG